MSVLSELAEVQDQLLRYMLDMVVSQSKFSPEDIVATLSEAMDDQVERAARGGNYERASNLSLHAKLLGDIPRHVDNYEPPSD